MLMFAFSVRSEKVLEMISKEVEFNSFYSFIESLKLRRVFLMVYIQRINFGDHQPVQTFFQLEH